MTKAELEELSRLANVTKQSAEKEVVVNAEEMATTVERMARVLLEILDMPNADVFTATGKPQDRFSDIGRNSALDAVKGKIHVA